MASRSQLHRIKQSNGKNNHFPLRLFASSIILSSSEIELLISGFKSFNLFFNDFFTFSMISFTSQ